MLRTVRSRGGRLGTLGVVLMAATTLVVAAIALSSREASPPSASVLTSGAGPTADTPLSHLIARVPQHGIALGRPDAPVTLEEFADLQCPGCKQYTLSVLPSLIMRFVAQGRLRIVWRGLTFIGPDSLRAARMAQAAALQDRLWSFIAVFSYNAGRENTGYVTDAFLRAIGGAAPGLDLSQAFRDRASAPATEQLRESAALADAEDVHDTPSFLLGPTHGHLRPFEPDSILDPDAYASAIGALLRR